ncbi:hypothetical protein POM88_010910 [Heracleum sosnowskyi]|uniref:GCK domain-containing protein n=1 Tax=Heracleum sosnowskyi TaxID=360622 RepID=A0AAD8ITK3_9APIA|nr:hypothetical protein POM88_010910 [Heracleum sosnowskyi]
MGNMSSSGYQTPTEAPIVVESLNQPLVDSAVVKAEPENLENPEENLETPENMHGDVKSGDDFLPGMRDFNIVQEEEILASQTGDSNIVKAEVTLESQEGDSDTYKSVKALEKPTVDPSCARVQSLEKPEGDSNSVKVEETIESPQGDSNTSKSEEALEYPKLDSDDVKVQSFEKSEGDSDSIKTDESPKKPEGSLKLQEHHEDSGLYLFMKAGGCKDSFVAWERCIQAEKSAENDFLPKCLEMEAALAKCMEAHIEYYRPVLLGAEAEGTTELEKEDDHKEYAQTKAAANEELKKAKGKEDVQASN